MDLFRKNQKLIFWIVTIIIVPSFVVVWGVGGFFDDRQGQPAAFNIGTVNGKNISYQEFENFRKRMAAAFGGLPYEFAGAPTGTELDELYKYLFTYALLQDAEKAGSNASDLQIGTYLQYGHPSLSIRAERNDPQSMERAVDELCRQMMMTRQEFLQGVREWQTIGNYVMADANLAAVNDDTVYTFYAFNRAQVEFKRIRVNATDSIKEQARAEIMAKPAEELEFDARNYAASHADNPRYRTQSAWKFDYLLEPFVPESSVRQPTDEEILARYESGRASVYGDQPLENVREQVRSELVRLEVERQTLRNFTVDIDDQLRDEGGQAPLDEIVRLTPIAKYAVTSGDTGETPLPIAELVKRLPAGSETNIRLVLESIDGSSPDVRDALVNEWRNSFYLNLRPFLSDAGFFRLRLLDYQPSAPAEIDNADGSIKPEIYELALADMIGDRVDELVQEQALEMEQRLRQYSEAKEKGEAVDETLEQELAHLPTETLNYEQIADSMYEIGRLVVGDLYGPIPYQDGPQEGQELLLLVNRRVPSRADFEAETPEVKTSFRNLTLSNFRGNVGFTFKLTGPEAIVRPSPSIMGNIVERFSRQEITINQELVRAGEA